jgi:predicted DNA-binding transcriptional regulator AlpA
MTVQYLGPAQVAARYGLAPETIRSYAAQGKMPEPDVRIGPTAGWSEETIDAWWANRPGRGRRTDLASPTAG